MGFFVFLHSSDYSLKEFNSLISDGGGPAGSHSLTEGGFWDYYVVTRTRHGVAGYSTIAGLFLAT